MNDKFFIILPKNSITGEPIEIQVLDEENNLISVEKINFYLPAYLK